MYEVRLWITLLTISIILSLASAWGYSLGAKHKNQVRTASSLIPTSVLGLLALLIGFTFSMAIERFDERQKLVLAEANAIRATYLRADFLPASQSVHVKEMLREYTDVRLKVLDRQQDHDQQKVAAETENIQKRMWLSAVSAFKESPSSAASLFLTSLNEMADRSSEWDFVLSNRVPRTVYFIILFVACIGLFSLGYLSGSAKSHSLLGTLILSVLFSVVIVLIEDLDQPRRGLINVDQTSLIRVRSQIE